MNGFPAAAASLPIPPPHSISQVSCPSPTTRPEYLSFKFKNIGQPPTLLSRFTDAGAASDYRSPSPEQSNIEMTPSEDPAMMVSDDHRAPHPAPRKSLLDILGGIPDQDRNLRAITTQAQDPGVPESTLTSPPSASSFKHVLPRPESRTSSIARQLSAADVSRTEPTPSRESVTSELHTHEPQDADMADLYADPASPSRSPLSLFSDLSEAVRESAELDRITSLHHVLNAEREELLRRHEETTRSLSRTKSQLDHVLALTDEAIKMSTVFIEKEKDRLETKKNDASARIEHAKNLEAERRKAKELERIRQQQQERKAQLEMEQQAERRRLEEQRKKEEALVAERQRLEEIQARERAQAEERRLLEEGRVRMEEEERRRLADEDRRKREEGERKRQEEERLRKRLVEDEETMARKQEEERRTQLLERRRLAEEERRRKEAEAAAAKAEAEKQERIFQERRATVLKDKYRNYPHPGSGALPSDSPSTFEGTPNSNIPPIVVKDAPKDPQVNAEQHPGIAKSNRSRDTPTFVPAATQAGRLPPDLSQQVKVFDSGVDHAVKYEATSPVITPVDDAGPGASTPPTAVVSRPVSSMSTTIPVPAPATLPAPPHLPARPATHSRPPVPRGPHHHPPRRSRSRSRSSSRSPRRGSPIPRPPARASRSPGPSRSRYPPLTGRNDHYSPPHDTYRDGGSKYGRDSRSGSPPPHLPNPLKRTHQSTWDKADTPSKLDYSHPAKRRVASPLRSRSPPSPRPRPLTQPPAVVPARRPPQPGRHSKARGPLSLEQRLSGRPPHLSERIQWDSQN